MRESIEVLKGPNSVLYGAEAVGGVINIIRKKPQGTPSFDFMVQGRTIPIRIRLRRRHRADH